MAHDVEVPAAGEQHETPPDGAAGGSVRLRAALAGLPHYVPGASGANASVFKLSSNEVPGPVPAAVTSAILDAAEDVNRYPQMYADDLTGAIAQRVGLTTDHVLVGNGSVSLLELLLRCMCTDGDEVVYAWRSFEAYPILIQVTGATGIQVPLAAGGRHDLDAMADAISPATRVVIVCSPNNPTSATVSHSDLVRLLDAVPTGVMVILDEAYREFVRDADPIDARALLPMYKNLVVLRTFSKAYGLAGLRIGYALARRRLIKTLRTASTPFGVNAVAQAAGLAALRRIDEVEGRVAEVVAERERVLAALRAQGWHVPEPHGNFYWLDVGERALAFAQDAARSGVMVRPFAGDGVRVTVGEPEANDIALDLAGRWVGSQRGAESASNAD